MYSFHLVPLSHNYARSRARKSLLIRERFSFVVLPCPLTFFASYFLPLASNRTFTASGGRTITTSGNPCLPTESLLRFLPRTCMTGARHTQWCAFSATTCPKRASWSFCATQHLAHIQDFFKFVQVQGAKKTSEGERRKG